MPREGSATTPRRASKLLSHSIGELANAENTQGKLYFKCRLVSSHGDLLYQIRKSPIDSEL